MERKGKLSSSGEKSNKKDPNTRLVLYSGGLDPCVDNIFRIHSFFVWYSGHEIGSEYQAQQCRIENTAQSEKTLSVIHVIKITIIILTFTFVFSL